ncbi:hypothetical protein GCM10022286_00600 [Gryllotalpicola daejeonensis]|uniref:Uncharacterized protein n=1 Tax=Gryllotalpicola daejeonensis TaxID=993087 RepID=A0ABP7ZD02_9MICO
MTSINPNAENRRESNRRKNGQFGTSKERGEYDAPELDAQHASAAETVAVELDATKQQLAAIKLRIEDGEYVDVDTNESLSDVEYRLNERVEELTRESAIARATTLNPGLQAAATNAAELIERDSNEPIDTAYLAAVLALDEAEIQAHAGRNDPSAWTPDSVVFAVQHREGDPTSNIATFGRPRNFYPEQPETDVLESVLRDYGLNADFTGYDRFFGHAGTVSLDS